MGKKIKLGISAGLLGEKGRYDGGHNLDHYLKETLGKYVCWVPVCPEVEMGLTVPCEPMRLVGETVSPRLVTTRTGIDYTDRMIQWSDEKLNSLSGIDLQGFVFKSRSPSSGMKGVKVYGILGVPLKTGVGVFARAFMTRFPFLPVEDDGRLQDSSIRENFIERILVFKRWHDSINKEGSMKDLVSFHTTHELLIMAHSPRYYTLLGNLVARGKQYDFSKLCSEYITILMEALKLTTTASKIQMCCSISWAISKIILFLTKNRNCSKLSIHTAEV